MKGGARPGAGRPRKDPDATAAPEGAGRRVTRKPPKAIPGTTDPDEFFRLVLADPSQSMTDRMRAALALHGKGPPIGEAVKPEKLGKKQIQQARAEEIAAGSPYVPRTPPRLVRAS